MRITTPPGTLVSELVRTALLGSGSNGYGAFCQTLACSEHAMGLAVLRRTSTWRHASGMVKDRFPDLWGQLVDGWGSTSAMLEPVELEMHRLQSRWTARRIAEDLLSVKVFIMFVGRSRSGHTVVSSLLNAHPNIVIGQRLRVLRYVEKGFSPHEILASALVADRRFERMGRVGSKRYDYSVPGAWQGRYLRLDVVGDADVASGPISRRPDLFERLRETIGVPVRLVHVVRNPFDNITTYSIRKKMSLDDAVEEYFRGCERTDWLAQRTSPEEWLDVHHEALLADPRATLRRLCDFVGVSAPEDYLESASGILYSRPNRSRHQRHWSPELVGVVERRMSAYGYLDGYTFEEHTGADREPTPGAGSGDGEP
ncbi:MAG: sulfotransferase [Actinobacteria bacterium]|nr:sulfotransferase [Actinomycetota bacterium]